MTVALCKGRENRPVWSLCVCVEGGGNDDFFNLKKWN